MTGALEIYGKALTSTEPMEYVLDTGCQPSGLARWCSEYTPGDAGLLERCTGPTLDIGCGPGRLAASLTSQGIPALGIDISPAAVRLARARGATALSRDVFHRLPGEDKWARALLADGNIGIGGDPLRLLRRCRQLLAPDGLLLLELEPPGSPTQSLQMRLRVGTRTSDPFPWAFVAADALSSLAAAALFTVTETWTEAGRWFASLEKAEYPACHRARGSSS